MAGPFKDDDESGGVSTDKLAKQLEKAVKGEKVERDEPEDDDVKEYRVGEEEEEVTPAKTEAERESRWEKKQERKRLRDEADDLRKENARLREEREERTARAAESTLEMTRAAIERLGNGGKEAPDPFEQQMAQVMNAEESVIAEYNALNTAGQLTDAHKTRLQARARQVERAKLDVAVRQTMAREGIQRVDPEQASREARAAALRDEYSDVYADKRAVQFADGEFNKLVARGADVKSKKTFDLAMKAARAEFKLGTRERSDEDLDVDRRRFSGQSKAAGGAGGRTSKAISIKKGSSEWAMAQSMYSHLKGLSEEQRVQKWVNRVGSKS